MPGVFPEIARIFRSLSKRELVVEPEIKTVALKQDVLRTDIGDKDRVGQFLQNMRLTSDDICEAFGFARQTKNYAIMELLLKDKRLNPNSVNIGLAEADVAKWLLLQPNIRLTERECYDAIFGPHGGQDRLYPDHEDHEYDEGGSVSGSEDDSEVYAEDESEEHTEIIWNDLSTFCLLLSDERLVLSPEFCKKLCDDVAEELISLDWHIFGTPYEGSYYGYDNYVSWTNYQELAEILIQDKKFQPFSERLREFVY